MGSRAYPIAAGVLILSLVLSLLLSLAAPGRVQAQGGGGGSCQPPSCRDEGGGGGDPPIPPGPIAPDPPPGGGGDPSPPGPPGGGDPPPGGPPGGGGGGGGGGRGTFRTYYCAPIAYCDELADYTVWVPNDGTTGFLTSFSCRTYESCKGKPGKGGEDPIDPPCVPVMSDGGVMLECDSDQESGLSWNYYIKAWASIPPHRVRVEPFPRGLVTVPTELTLLAEPAISQAGGEHFRGDGFYSDRVNLPDPVRTNEAGEEDPHPGDIKDYEIGVRWRRVGDKYPLFGQVPAHCFSFDDRAWNGGVGNNVACGRPRVGDGAVVASHTYETASWNKLANGPRVDLDEGIVVSWDLPSYQVSVDTYWIVEWRSRWQAWEATGGMEWSDCTCHGTGEPVGIPHESCDPPPGICYKAGEWYGKIGEPAYDWVLHDTDWYPLDLRDYGYPNWYDDSQMVIGGGEFNGRDWWSGIGNAVPVPIIEVQSVLEPN